MVSVSRRGKILFVVVLIVCVFSVLDEIMSKGSISQRYGWDKALKVVHDEHRRTGVVEQLGLAPIPPETLEAIDNEYRKIFYRSFPDVERSKQLSLETVLWSRNWKHLMDCNATLPHQYGTNTEQTFSADEMKTVASCRGYVFVPSNSHSQSNVNLFIKEALPLMQDPFVLISADGDNSFPGAVAKAGNLATLLDNPLLIRWYTQNYDATLRHPKLFAIPIGLDLHTPRDGQDWNTPEGFADLYEIRHAGLTSTRILDPFLPKWSPCHHPDRDTIQPTLEACNATYVAQPEWEPVRSMAQKFSQYAAGISPHGNGLDSHRTWEMLLYGMIPIVKTSSLDVLYQGRVPVIILEKWEDLCRDSWEEEIERAKHLSPPPDEVLTMQYWLSP